MGCEGCELWPTNASLKLRMVAELISHFPSVDEIKIREAVENALGDDVPSRLWKNRRSIIEKMVTKLSLYRTEIG